jgi:hypothetical protein
MEGNEMISNTHHPAAGSCRDSRSGPAPSTAAPRTNGTNGDSTHGSPFLFRGPLDALGTVLRILAFSTEEEGPVFLSEKDGFALLVPVRHVAALEIIVAEAIGMLESAYQGVGCCLECGGTILPPSTSGALRGSCHCAWRSQPQAPFHAQRGD